MYLPMSLVKSIHFREDQNRQLFGSTSFCNIEFDKSMFFTTPELFDGELSINKKDITLIIKKIKVPNYRHTKFISSNNDNIVFSIFFH